MSTLPRPKTNPPDSTRTTPTPSTGSGIRRALTPTPISPPLTPVLAALSFLEGVATRRIQRGNLETWIEQNLISPGYVPGPLRIHEPIFGALPTDKGCKAFLPETPPDDETSALLVRARARVVGHLQGLLRSPVEDRFIAAAIFAKRIRRTTVNDAMTWIPHPHADDCLSDVITSLFVSDILTRREFHEQNLCICQSCGRVRFECSHTAERHRCFFC